MIRENNDFRPDWVSPPGDTIVDVLKVRNLSPDEFAERMGQTPEQTNELVRGRAMITIETARKLEVVLGASAAFWMVRESQYRGDIDRLIGEKPNPVDVAWLSELPLKDMIKFGWLKPDSRSANQALACLEFFNVSDVGTWRETYRDVLKMASFRTSPSFESQPGAAAAWLRQCEIESAAIDCNRWDPKRFQELLSHIRPLTRKKDPSFFIPELVKRCAECGVAVVIVRAPSGCRASGATRFLSSSRALLALSFRYLSDDHFWFTFFHEAGHLLLHGKKTLFLEGANGFSNKAEEEANQFAAHVLIPSSFQAELLKLPLNAMDVIRFAKRVGVSPGIVVGQLQHLQQIKSRQLNNLKRRYIWNND